MNVNHLHQIHLHICSLKLIQNYSAWVNEYIFSMLIKSSFCLSSKHISGFTSHSATGKKEQNLYVSVKAQLRKNIQTYNLNWLHTARQCRRSLWKPHSPTWIATDEIYTLTLNLRASHEPPRWRLLPNLLQLSIFLLLCNICVL